ncbi:sterol desaturase [Streptosporangium violaceochromogenes]|nr:sterol desaturase [Streptosporangium violaceochromogenes]
MRRGRENPTLPPRPVLCRVAYPVLLAGTVSTAGLALRHHLDFGQVNLFFLAGTVTYLAVLERLIPYERDWHPDRDEWGWYAVYFLLTMIGSALAQLPVAVLVGAVSLPGPALALWAEIPLALLLSSLAGYLVHRLGHTNRWLWRLHGVHHVPRKVTVANNGVNHILDVVLAQAVVQLALALVGFSRESVFVVGLFVLAQGYFVHANIDVRLGRLNYLLVGPEQHRLHHSVDLSEAGHYGSDLAIWDWMFNSFTWRPGRRPVAVGLRDPATFPETGAFVASLLHPWRRPFPRPSTETGGRPA